MIVPCDAADRTVSLGIAVHAQQIMWRRKQLKETEQRVGFPVSTQYDPYFRLDVPASCLPPRMVEPARNPSDPAFRSHIHSYLIHAAPGPPAPGLGTPADVDDWGRWQQVEPGFRNQAENEMYDQYYQLLWVRARLSWWQANAGTLQQCIDAARARPLTSSESLALHASIVDEDKEIDSKWDRMIKTVRETFAPREAKPETIDRLQGMKEIEKYEHDMDRSEKASPSPSPHETHDVLH